MSNPSSTPANNGSHANGSVTAVHDIPQTTKRWVIRNFTGPDGLELEEAPIPELGANDVLVKRKPHASFPQSSRPKERTRRHETHPH